MVLKVTEGKMSFYLYHLWYCIGKYELAYRNIHQNMALLNVSVETFLQSKVLFCFTIFLVCFEFN